MTKLIAELRSGKRVRIEMPENDTLADGRKLVKRLQKTCGFQLAYYQNIGQEPYLVVWMFKGMRNDHAA